MTEKAIWYEFHPVSPERKAELSAKGFLIVDAVFKPDDYENPSEDDKQEDKAPRKKRGE